MKAFKQHYITIFLFFFLMLTISSTKIFAEDNNEHLINPSVNQEAKSSETAAQVSQENAEVKTDTESKQSDQTATQQSTTEQKPASEIVDYESGVKQLKAQARAINKIIKAKNLELSKAFAKVKDFSEEEVEAIHNELNEQFAALSKIKLEEIKLYKKVNPDWQPEASEKQLKVPSKKSQKNTK